MITRRSRLAAFSMALCACAAVSCGSADDAAVSSRPAVSPTPSSTATISTAGTTPGLPTSSPDEGPVRASDPIETEPDGGSAPVEDSVPVGDSVPTSGLPPAPVPGADQPHAGDVPPASGGTPTAPDSEWCLDPESPGVLDVLAGLGTDSMGLRFVTGWWDRTTVADGCPSLNWVRARGNDQDMRAEDNFYLFFDAQGNYLGPATPEFHINSLLTSSTDNSATILFRSRESLPDHSGPLHESEVTYTLEDGSIVVEGQLPGADWG